MAFAVLACTLFISACSSEPEPTPTVGPTSTPEPAPSPIPISFNQFSFSLDLDGIYSISTAPILDPLPSDKSGTLIWAKGIMRYALSWRPPEEAKDEEESNNQRLVSLDRSLNILQVSNPGVVISEISQPATENILGHSVTFKTFQIKAGETLSKGLASTFFCAETSKDFLLGIIFTEDPKATLSETVSKFKCVKAAS